ncbi:ABC transporter permease [Brevibacillus sp. NRS-1366]|uniref:ABC transporter permease n=1 Tax=Brevibacillus sp. NRS-1366 TaxID=3233899 RepID=UPI003D24CAFF
MLSIFLLCGLITIQPNFVDAAPNYHGIVVATVDSNKELAPKGKFDILSITDIAGRLGATVSQIEVDQVIDDTRVLGFADTNVKADRGWYFVDNSEASYWITRFGGNPNNILGGSANVYSKTVSSNEVPNFSPYQAYNLAELASASGGAGYTKGDNLVSNGSGGYISVGHFRTTPRPTGDVSTNKTKYQVNEQVTITANATDYSYYDRGILIWNLSVINKTTGRGHYSFEANTEIRDQSGYLPPVNETSTPKDFPWAKSYQYKPTEAGVYEVSLTITDRHHRSRQGSPSMSVSTPYTYQFTVGDSPPPDPGDGGDPDPGPACSVDSSKTKMDINVNGDKDVKNYTGIASGGTSIAVEKYAEISVYAKKPGTFKINGVEMSSYKGDRKTGVASVGDSGRYRVVYTSDDGTECWEKNFDVSRDNDKIDKCPIVSVSGKTVRSGETIEILASDSLVFIAKYTDKNGDTLGARVLWDVTKPDGKVVSLPGEYNERGRWGSVASDKLNLPYGNGKDVHDLLFEKGKTYKLKLNYTSTTWEDRPECNWEVTIKVKDVSCSITEQNMLQAKVHGYPPNPFSPEGDTLNGAPGGQPSTLPGPVYFRFFTAMGNEYDTNMGFSANAPGTWYLKDGSQRTALSGKLAANEKFDLILSADIVESYGQVVLEFVSDKGCVELVSFTIESDRKCYDFLVMMQHSTSSTDKKWSKEIKRGETIELSDADYDGNYMFRVFTDIDTKFAVRWLDPATNKWEWKRNGEYLSSESIGRNSYWVNFPRDKDTKKLLDGFYKVEIYDGVGCDGHFFVQIGEGPPKPNPDGENLLIVKTSFAINPSDPQEPGTEATISFDIKNDGKLSHDTKLAVRWESSDKETVLDVAGFNPGEVRKITIPTKYPQKSEYFIANINPSKNKPDNEKIWPDNRAQWPVEVIGGSDPKPPDPEGPGGNFEGGEIGLEIYDTDDRQLQKLQINADGVWEREPAKIRVVIDQTKINEGFNRTQQKINQKITEYKAVLQQAVSGDHIKNVVVSAVPEWISDAKSMAVYNPAMLDLKVSGPGTPGQWQVSSASTGGDYVFTGTIVPTQTTWRQVLNAQKYKAAINGFVITMDYSIQFDVSYESCSETEQEDGSKEEVCEPKSINKTMTGRFTITVKGGEREFEVFEPNATGSIHHTEEWKEYHSRDRYPNSQPNDFYAGERILAQIELQPRHRHPVSGQLPGIASAQAWISETGLRQTSLQSQLFLRQVTPGLWKSPSYSASKLGTREQGVDTPLMGDKQHGFKKDASYAVYYHVQFRFDVNKGYPYNNKTAGNGHELTDYRVPFRIIANAWERQGIRNHTTQ